jgi:D-beta-D-heptose 7-phosphate kinase/D-beta-D-heptose 1-phosphate adenosyltransferase
MAVEDRPTGLKTRVIAHQQHVVRIDRERRGPLGAADAERLAASLLSALPGADAVLVGDYAKGVVSQGLLEALKAECRQRAIWLSVDRSRSTASTWRAFAGDAESEERSERRARGRRARGDPLADGPL